MAARVAEEMRCQVGEDVGYSIRFEDATSAKTRIRFLTDGMLLREALVDPLLSRYSVIMVDEAHERSLSSDVLLGLLKKIMRRRPELRMIVSSATLQAEAFATYFARENGLGGLCKVVSIEGRAYPVDVLYLEDAAEDYVQKAVQTAYNIHTQELQGDVLVFMTGREEIDTAVQLLSDMTSTLHPNAQALQPLPLYAGLTTEQQMYVFEPAAENTRKVVLATNIAEASVTIEGIVYIIDTGFVKLRAYDPVSGVDSLTPLPISKASAIQRAGRAGRTKPGKCYRLYTEAAFCNLRDETVPEIQRSNLAPIILQLKALGIDNIVRFDFLSAPPSKLVIRAFELLYSLGAVDDYAKLTNPLGQRMAELGSVEPMMAKVLLSASSFGCLSEVLTIAAMTSLQGDVWFHHEGDKKGMESSRRKFAVEEGDHLTLLNVYQAFVKKGRKDAKWCRDNHLNYKSLTKAVSIRGQLRRNLERFGIAVDETLGSISHNGSARSTLNVAEQIRRCLSSGYFAHAAKMQPDGTFQSVNGRVTLHAHPTSLMFVSAATYETDPSSVLTLLKNRKADYVIFHEMLETGNKIFIRDITKIEKQWLLDYAPEFYKVKS